MSLNKLLGSLFGRADGSNQDKQGKSDSGSLLDSLLGSVSGSVSQSKAGLGGILNSVFATVGEAKSGNADAIGKLGGGTALIGILSMVLGRNGGANLAKLGSLAALGSMAYKAYQAYQQKQSDEQSSVLPDAFIGTQSDENNVVILQAMISAAFADGELDAQEQALLEQEGANTPALAELVANPATPKQIAENVGNNPALASQVYLAARLVCQELSRKEILFLGELANELGLEDALVEQLEKQAGF